MTAPPVDVLIAEDDALVRGDLRTLLELEGFRCETASDGRAAVEIARRSQPRCAILDLVMPGMDGFTVARHLRADPLTRRVHIHCLTGLTDPAVRAQAQKAGFETYLTKPVDPVQLLCAIRGPGMDTETVVEKSGLSISEARDMLDFWENAGYRDLQTTYTEGEGFSVRAVRPGG